jgi:CheY-like chemotaxis protein
MSDDAHLFWSRRGEIACAAHAPAAGSTAWSEGSWQPMPDFGLRMAKYQCQHCEGVPLRAFRRADAGTPLILNVDDKPASLYLRNRALREHGFTVANAATGRDAIAFARRLQPQLVLLDVHLPDMDGRTVCEVLKNDTETAGIPVVLISATLGLRGDSFDALGPVPADGYVAEPVAPEQLATAVRRLLRAG